MSKLNISPKEIVNNTFDSVNSVKSMWLRLSRLLACSKTNLENNITSGFKQSKEVVYINQLECVLQNKSV